MTEPITGVLNVYKQRGMTSHDVVYHIRKITGQKKTGHTGTLDPDAEGVLPICLGTATRLNDLLGEGSKQYRAVMALGVTTDTLDLSGTVLERRPVTCTEAQIREVILSFLGEIEQIPPMYSAVKMNGKKLYELARKGIEVERKGRLVTIEEIAIGEIRLAGAAEALGESAEDSIGGGTNPDGVSAVGCTGPDVDSATGCTAPGGDTNGIGTKPGAESTGGCIGPDEVSAVGGTKPGGDSTGGCTDPVGDSASEKGMSLNTVEITVTCSKGTYIRTLCSDIGEKLGCGASILSLERTRVGSFSADSALTLEQIRSLFDAGELDRYIIPPDRFFPEAAPAGVSEENQIRLQNGNPFPKRLIRLLPPEEDPIRRNASEGFFYPAGSTERADTVPGCSSYSARTTDTTDIKSDSSAGSGRRRWPPRLRFYDSSGRFTGIYQWDNKGLYRPEKMFL